MFQETLTVSQSALYKKGGLVSGQIKLLKLGVNNSGLSKNAWPKLSGFIVVDGIFYCSFFCCLFFFIFKNTVGNAKHKILYEKISKSCLH